MSKITLLDNPISTTNSDTEVIMVLFATVWEQLMHLSPNHPNAAAEIRISFRHDVPRVLSGGNSTDGFDVHLAAKMRRWDQYLYQFNHEACHIFAQFLPNEGHCNQWFEESLCEAASIFFLRKVADLCREKRTLPHKRLVGNRYPAAFREYAEKMQNSPDRICDGPRLQRWFSEYERVLRLSPYVRCLNGTVANRLLQLLETEPSHWGAVAYLNSAPCASGKDSFSHYLEQWREASPEKHRPFIDQVRLLFM
jgi:hypothetical protein